MSEGIIYIYKLVYKYAYLILKMKGEPILDSRSKLFVSFEV